jgi:hypothetical protein
LPTSSIDTFFACTIILAAALIATASLTSTLQTGVLGTADTNENSYLQAIADRIVTSAGAPVNWGSTNSTPTDFGLAASASSIPYQLDIDKISRLNSQNNCFLPYDSMVQAANLNGIAFGISISQIMGVIMQPLNSSTVGNQTSITFNVMTSVELQPVSASLKCYTLANGYFGSAAGNTSSVGVGTITVQVPSAQQNNASIFMFAKASFDDRVTSYAVYSLATQTQQSIPTNDILTLTPLNNCITFQTNSSDLTIQNAYVLSYNYAQNNPSINSTSPFQFPSLIDKSPLVIVVCGVNQGVSFQQWVSYPQVPLVAGSTFVGTEQNVFTYTVTIGGVLYNLQVSLGSVPQ